MTPLHYQKRMRLQEARSLMIGEKLDAASAAFRVITKEHLTAEPPAIGTATAADLTKPQSSDRRSIDC